MIIEAFHKTTGQRLILEYDTLKEAIARTGHYLHSFAIVEPSPSILQGQGTAQDNEKTSGDGKVATPPIKT